MAIRPLQLISPLHLQTILSGRNTTYYFNTPPADLSIKTMANGRALYEIEGGHFAVGEDTYLVLNDRQPYQITIDSPTIVESFCIFFPPGWAEQVWRGLHENSDRLLDSPFPGTTAPVHFFERVRPRDAIVFDCVMALRDDLEQRPISPLELEERLRALLARLICTQFDMRQEAEKMSTLRPSTRNELYQRLYRARDYIDANLMTTLNLAKVANIACLSPYHFLRMFKQAFGQTPHAYLTNKRIEWAQFLLARTRLPITEICFEAGFESLGSFSTKFRQVVGLSPRAYRQQHKT
jgi:AraC family transcriptional regulator